MKTARFAALVQRHEAACARDPQGFRRATTGWLLLPWLLPWVIFAGLLGGFVALLWMVAELPAQDRSVRGWVMLVLFLGLLLGSYFLFFLWPRIRDWFWQKPRFRGQRMRRSDEPAFFAFLEEARAKGGHQIPDEVWLTNDNNAAVAAFRRVPIFGFHRLVLIIGLPILQALRRDEASTVIAHELGHLQGRHPQFGTWTARAMRFPAQMAQWAGLSPWHPLQWLGQAADHWCSHLNARLAALHREFEFEVDARAAAAVGAEPTAKALVKFNVFARWAGNDCLPAYQRLAADLQEPKGGIGSLFHGYLREGLPPGVIELRYHEAISEITRPAFSHPALQARLQRLRQTPTLPRYEAPSAAESIWGEQLPELMETMDREWRIEVIPDWHQFRGALLHSQARYKELQQVMAEGKLRLDQARDLLRSASVCLLPGELVPVARAVHALFPEDAEVNFAFGRALYLAQEGDCRPWLERATEGPFHLIMAAYNMIFDRALQLGDAAGAQKVLERWFEAEDQMRPAELERQTLKKEHQLTKAKLQGIDIERLSAAVSRVDPIEKVWVALKQSSFWKNDRHYVLAVAVAWRTSEHDRQRIIAYLLHELALEYPVQVVLTGGWDNPAQKVVHLAGNPVYERHR